MFDINNLEVVSEFNTTDQFMVLRTDSDGSMDIVSGDISIITTTSGMSQWYSGTYAPSGNPNPNSFYLNTSTGAIYSSTTSTSGSTSTTTWQLNPVMTIQGAKGDAGTNGESAYQVAVANGYTGTVTQWLASLKGASTVATVSSTTLISTTSNPSTTLGTVTDAALSAVTQDQYNTLSSSLSSEITARENMDTSTLSMISPITSKVSELSSDGSTYSGLISSSGFTTDSNGNVTCNTISSSHGISGRHEGAPPSSAGVGHIPAECVGGSVEIPGKSDISYWLLPSRSSSNNGSGNPLNATYDSPNSTIVEGGQIIIINTSSSAQYIKTDEDVSNNNTGYELAGKSIAMAIQGGGHWIIFPMASSYSSPSCN